MDNSSSLNIESIAGEIERITYFNESNGFCVLKVKAKGQRDLITITANLPSIHAGEFIEAKGFWVNDKNFGLQFKASQAQVIAPNNIKGIEKYLASGLIKGIGTHYAKLMTDRFGLDIIAILDDNPESLLGLPGIGVKRLETIKKSWESQKTIRQIMVYLQTHGVGTARAFRIYKAYGDKAIEIISENPYRLADDIWGIGFKTADTIAKNIGIAADSIIRAKAGLRFMLKEASSQGHVALIKDKLLESTHKALDIPLKILNAAIGQDVGDKLLVAQIIEDAEYIYLTSLFQAEVSLANNLIKLNSTHFDYGIDSSKAIALVEAKYNLKLSDSQIDAISSALNHKILIITGGPGVGKTTIVKCIIEIISQKNKKIALCAPTGRASKRLNETTGLEAKTIHRLLEFDPSINNFKKNKDNKLDIDLLIVDEASMIDLILMNKLIQALPNDCQLILIGDIDQLPSVGPGNVLADLIKSQRIKTIRLTQIFRQAALSQIVTNAHLINSGKMVNTKYSKNESSDFYFIEGHDNENILHKLLEVVCNRIPDKFKLDRVKDIQVLTPMNRGSLGSRSLNVELQKKLNPGISAKIEKFGQTYKGGDKVIQMVNNYQKEVFNGDIGSIVEINENDSTILVNFDNKIIEYDFNEVDELNLAYATSIHKSQGSEYPCVVIPLSMQHYPMLERNLLYTGITRGKKLVIVIGENKALYMAIKNKAAVNRFTSLSYRLGLG